jgi:hypothetical protein
MVMKMAIVEKKPSADGKAVEHFLRARFALIISAIFLLPAGENVNCIKQNVARGPRLVLYW